MHSHFTSGRMCISDILSCLCPSCLCDLSETTLYRYTLYLPTYPMHVYVNECMSTSSTFILEKVDTCSPKTYNTLYDVHECVCIVHCNSIQLYYTVHLPYMCLFCFFVSFFFTIVRWKMDERITSNMPTAPNRKCRKIDEDPGLVS